MARDIGGCLGQMSAKVRDRIRRAARTQRSKDEAPTTRTTLPPEGIVTIEYSPRIDGDPDLGEGRLDVGRDGRLIRVRSADGRGARRLGGFVRLLLDTHTFVWAVSNPDELSGRARGLIEDPSNELLVSAASAWEISTKHRLGKFPQAEAIIRGFSSAIERLRSSELSISVEHALTAGDFDQPHRDPFGRMLAAQAVVEGATLVTRDGALANFPINIEW